MGGIGLVTAVAKTRPPRGTKRQGLTPGSNHRRTHEIHTSHGLGSTRKGAQAVHRDMLPVYSRGAPQHWQGAPPWEVPTHST